MPRVSIFGPKEHSTRIQGELTPDGAKAFESARQRIAKYLRRLTGRDVCISEGDTVEYLARGEKDAQAAITKVYNGR